MIDSGLTLSVLPYSWFIKFCVQIFPLVNPILVKRPEEKLGDDRVASFKLILVVVIIYDAMISL